MARRKDAEAGAGGDIRMRDVAQLTGLPPSTIHFYIRSGLVPQPEKTGPNQARYGLEFVERVRLIKLLQQQAHLPLSEIREALEKLDTDAVPATSNRIVTVARDVIESLHEAAGSGSAEPIRVTDLSAKGVKSADVKRLLDANLVTAIDDGKRMQLTPLDAHIATAFARVREALGTQIEPMMPIFALFASHIRTMAKVEATQITSNLARWKSPSGDRAQPDPTTRARNHQFLQALRMAQDEFVAAVHHRELALALAELVEDADDSPG